jgi:hypothetical protein
MASTPSRLLLVLVLLAGVLAAAGGPRLRHDGAAEGASVLSEDARRATFAFDPAVAPGDRDVLEAAVAGARPEARRLVAIVDGLVDLRVGAAGPTALGATRIGGPRYEVTIDVARTMAATGARGVGRVVWHELGHVLDDAVLPDDIASRLDAGIPRGWGCDGGRAGACADRAERFAETFAKWATGDIGVSLPVGYKVPPPAVSLDAWGEPLAAFAAAVG